MTRRYALVLVVLAAVVAVGLYQTAPTRQTSAVATDTTRPGGSQPETSWVRVNGPTTTATTLSSAAIREALEADPEWQARQRSLNARILHDQRDAATTTTVAPVRIAPTTVPTTTRPPSTTSAGTSYPWTGDPRIEQWRPLIERHFTEPERGRTIGEVQERALGILRCESVGDPGANQEAWGEGPDAPAWLFSHLRRYWADRATRAIGWVPDLSGPHDADADAAVAAWLVYHNGGWGHWPSCIEWVRGHGA